MKTIYTLGYEGVTLPDFLRTLENTGVSLLFDVRELPQSRRPGFSKRVLSEALEDAGIDYQHIRQLGDPKAGRIAARRGDMNEFRSIFNAHLDLDETQKSLREVAKIASAKTVALMCFERAACDCHRSLVAERLGRIGSFKIVNIGVHTRRSIGEVTDGTTTGKHNRAYR